MRGIKRLDIYLLKNFLGLFLATFFIAVFILLMQFVWMHVKDLVGKGVEMSVLAEFFIYAIASVVPLALPLAILLASLISFGNLGEKFELTAMKAAGISLFRIMQPLAIAIAFISVGAFFFSNNVLPKSQTKLWALIFSLRQKSPELDIPVGEFYDGIGGTNVYVRQKNNKTGMMYGLMIYDFSEGFKNATVIVADSGKIQITKDKQHLLLTLYSGESFENLDQKQQKATGAQKNIPYRRETFERKQILKDFNTELNRYDESMLQDQHVAKNVVQLVHSIDSMGVLAQGRSRMQSEKLVEKSYFGRGEHNGRILQPVEKEEWAEYDVDSLYAHMSDRDKRAVISSMLDKVRIQEDQIKYNSMFLEDFHRYIRKHEIELHRKFTLAFACLIFFFIGAPLGAIIRKGGLGAPVVISVIMFIIYYIIDNTGYKMAREALWPTWMGMWLSSFALLPIGAFLTYKAATDSGMFNPEAWLKAYEQFKVRIIARWTKLKKH